MNDEVKVNLTVTVSEANVILKVLGDLPTNSGAYPLLVNLQNQAQSQLGEGGPVEVE